MDTIATSLIAFGTIQAAAMILTEWLALPLFRSKIEPGKNLPWRKRLSCFVYATTMASIAVPAGLLELPEAANPWLAVPLLGFLSTIIAFGFVKGKKALGNG